MLIPRGAQPEDRQTVRVWIRQGFSKRALTTVKIAVLAPMPMASEATMTSVDAGLLLNVRMA